MASSLIFGKHNFTQDTDNTTDKEGVGEGSYAKAELKAPTANGGNCLCCLHQPMGGIVKSFMESGERRGWNLSGHGAIVGEQRKSLMLVSQQLENLR